MTCKENKDNPKKEQETPLQTTDVKKNIPEENAVKSAINTEITSNKKDNSDPIRTESQKHIHDRIIRRWTRVLGANAVILSAVYIIGIIFTYMQMIDSAQTTVSTFGKMEKVINSLQISDSINKAALNNAGKSFEIENRAFLLIDDFPIENTDNVYGFYVDIKNFGRTPAYFNYMTGQIDTTAKAFMKYIDTVKLESNTRKKVQNIVLGSGQQYRIVCNRPILNHSAGVNALFYSGMINRYVWGCILYKDFFGKQHHIHFCGVLDWQTNGFTPIGKCNDAN